MFSGKKNLFSAFLFLVLLLGCAHAAAFAEAAEARSIRFPNGSSHYSYEINVDLSDLAHADVPATIELLKEFPQLHRVDLGQGPMDPKEEARLNWTDIHEMQSAFPGVEFLYRFRFLGYDFTTLDTSFDLNHLKMEDEGAAVREILPCMQNCKLLDMDFCGVSSEAMEQIRDEYPQMEVIWRIWFGHDCSVRTDVDHILASNLNHCLSNNNTKDLKYCTKVKYFDVGHNLALSDFSFLSYMPDLEVAILSVTGLYDLNQLAECEKLEYLEICNCTRDIDVSPLANLKHLHHLNMNYLGYVTGAEALCELKELERLWIGGMTYLDADTLEQIRDALPNTEIDVVDTTGCSGTWRFTSDGGLTERYALLKQQFDYDRYPYSCSSYTADPRYYYRN